MASQDSVEIQLVLNSRGLKAVAIPNRSKEAFRDSIRLLSNVAWVLEFLDTSTKYHSQRNSRQKK